MIAFGRPYITNPDLVERFTNDWPLAKEASYEDYYATLKGAKGYNDYPNFKQSKSNVCNIF
jgi:2,4-dienoyl-CoA reductase-like NADH-dependent reductase (Old Yellow Enzyme family)